MSIDAEAVIHPAGRILPALFPARSGTDLLVDIDTWLEEAYALPRVSGLTTSAAKDAAAKLWAEYRAFSAACIRMSANPNRAAQTDAGSHEFAKDQRDNICGLATSILAEFEAAAPEVATSKLYAGSRTVRHTFAW